jgi:hypothetical protein
MHSAILGRPDFLNGIFLFFIRSHLRYVAGLTTQITPSMLWPSIAPHRMSSAFSCGVGTIRSASTRAQDPHLREEELDAGVVARGEQPDEECPEREERVV